MRWNTTAKQQSLCFQRYAHSVIKKNERFAQRDFMKTTGLTLALTIMLIAPVAASADGLLTTFVKDTLQVTGDVVGGTVGLAGSTISGTVDSVGNVIDTSGRVVGHVILPNQMKSGVTEYGDKVILLGSTNDVYGYSLDTRLSDLRKAVDAAESQGKLGSAQASDLRQQLASISTNQINAQSDGVFTFDESLAIARDLDKVNVGLANMISVQPYGQLVAIDGSGTARIFVTTPHRNASTVTSTRTVSNGVDTTSVTTVTSTNAQPMSSGAMFSILDNRRYQLDKMIGDAKIRGTITESQDTELQAKSDHVRLLMLDRGAELNSQQAVKIARELDALDSDIASALKTTSLQPLTVVDTTSGNARIVSDQFGRVIAISEGGPDIYIKTLEGRRLDLEARLAAGQASGSIAAQQARDLRTELDRVARVQASQRSNEFTYVDALPLAMSLDYVGQEIVQVIPTYSYAPLINGSRFVIFDGRVVMLDDVMVRRGELESKIARMRATGRLSARQAATLRADLSKIAIVEKQMRAKGALTFKDSRELYKDFDRVGSRLDGYHASLKSTGS
jgi:hypothetical protein